MVVVPDVAARKQTGIVQIFVAAIAWIKLIDTLNILVLMLYFDIDAYQLNNFMNFILKKNCFDIKKKYGCEIFGIYKKIFS